MQPVFEKINPPDNYSFNIHHAIHPYFITPWHYHPECEILYVEKSYGTRFVGDSIEGFVAGDLVMVGAFLPHFWQNDLEFEKTPIEDNAKALVIHFREDFWGEKFFNLPEMTKIKELTQRSKFGIKFKGGAKDKLVEKMIAMKDLEGSARIISLIDLLNAMAQSNEYELLSSPGFANASHLRDMKRINEVYEYVINNFKKEIKLEFAASLICMSSSAFCRYFKKHTHRTFFDYVNEVRIGYACRLLIENRFSISQICFESGFNNFTHFNKQFKKIKKQTPLSFKKQHCS